MDTLLHVDKLRVVFDTAEGRVVPVDDISFSVAKGEILCIVGESGSGKSVTSLSIVKLLGSAGEIASGRIAFKDRDVAQLSEFEMRKLRGKEIGFVFQEPMTSLNPLFTIGNQMVEMITQHLKMSKAEATKHATQLLDKVGIRNPAKVMNDYPHVLSGGMRQRVMIAMALSCDPSLLIADEPTTALDVTIQAQILELIRNIRTEFHTSVMLITHDLGVVAEMADRVLVMYAGEIVEDTSVFTLFDNPQHPYTIGLMESIPALDAFEKERLSFIEGSVPSLNQLPQGCRFADRCKFAQEICLSSHPKLEKLEEGHLVRCHQPWLTQE